MTPKGDAKHIGKLTRALKNDIKNLVILLPKGYKILDEQVRTEELYLMTLRSDAKFEEKLTPGFKMTLGIW